LWRSADVPFAAVQRMGQAIDPQHSQRGPFGKSGCVRFSLQDGSAAELTIRGAGANY